MFLTLNTGKVLFTLVCVILSCFSFSLISCGTDSDIQRLQAALERSEERAEKVAQELKNTKSELERIKKQSEQGLPESAQKRITELEKLIEKIPQATIENVRIGRKKKNMDVYVRFNIKNRKDIECFVKGYLFHRRKSGEKFEKLYNKKGDPISISEEFTPENVTETRTVEFSISYAKLNVTQRRDLRFDFHIYDKPTDSFLDTKPYSKSFSFDPWEN